MQIREATADLEFDISTIGPPILDEALEDLLREQIGRVESGGSMNDQLTYNSISQLREMVTKASTEADVCMILNAIRYLQEIKTPLSHYMQIELLYGLKSWIYVKSIVPEGKKAKASEFFGPPVSVKVYKSICTLLAIQMSDMIASTFDARRSSQKIQEFRSMAIEIFEAIIPIQKDRNVVNLSRAVLSSASSGDRDCAAALSLLAAYYECYENEKPEPGLIPQLKKLAKSSSSEVVAFGALNVLVKCGAIDEFDAMASLDDWKDKYVYG